MKTKSHLITLTLTVFLSCSAGLADDFGKHIVSVQSTNGLTFGVTVIDSRNGTNTTESSVGFLFKAPPKFHSLLFLPKDEFMAKLELYDSSGHPVKKTESGSKYGRRLDAIYWDIKKFADRPHSPSWREIFGIPRLGEK